MEKSTDVHIENDKQYAPFLLAASFNKLIKFIGSFSQNGVLYWQFSPKDKAQILIEQFKTKTEQQIPARDVFEAIETFWQQVSSSRNGKAGNNLYR